MSITIGSNIASLQSQRRLFETGEKLSTVFERLSSGQRINRAVDDAAGLAVSSTLDNKSRILNRAKLNLNDATTLLQIADSALSQIGDLYTRMKELAEQSANGTLGDSQRDALQEEYTQLEREILRIKYTTKFNDRELLSGGQVNVDQQLVIASTFGVEALDISANGRFQLFEQQGGASSDLVVYDRDTGESTTLTTQASGFTDAAMTENGDVYFITSGNIYFAGRESGTVEQLSSDGNARLLDVSQDGSRVGFLSNEDYVIGGTFSDSLGSGDEQIYILDTETNTIEGTGDVINTTVPTNPFTDLVISDDGTQVAAKLWVGGSDQLYLLDTSGETASQQQLAQASSLGIVLSGVTNSGEVILTSTNDLANGGSTSTSFEGIYSVSSDGTITEIYRGENTALGRVSMSADGQSLHFLAQESYFGGGSSFAAYRFDRDLGEMKQITASGILDDDTDLAENGALFSADGSAFITIDDIAGIWGLGYDLRSAEETFDFEAGFGAEGRIALDISGVSSAVSGLGGYSLGNQALSRFALDYTSDAIDSVSQLRGEIGATMSRLQTALTVTQIQGQESGAASARIKDADIAAEAADLTRLQITQNAASAVIGQANLQPALALTLLQ